MKDYYKYGEIIIALREEYQKCKILFDEMYKYINIKSNNMDYYFTGSLSNNINSDVLDDRKIKLIIERRYLSILKLFDYLKYGDYSKYFYKAKYNVSKNDNNLYEFVYDDVFYLNNKKEFKPEIEINNPGELALLVDELLQTDLMQLKMKYINNYDDTIVLNFDKAHIMSHLGEKSLVRWNGIEDDFEFILNNNSNPLLVTDILSSKISKEKIPFYWLNLLEKNEDICKKEFFFDLYSSIESRKGCLEITDIKRNDDYDEVKLTKKKKSTYKK